MRVHRPEIHRSPGTWQHYTLPIKELADLFENGNGFDGSSIRGFRAIHESDMLLFADRLPQSLTHSVALDFEPDLRCKRPVDGKDYDRDPVMLPERLRLSQDHRHR